METLDVYRSKASFDVKLMFEEMQPAKNIEIKKRVWHFMASNPLFHVDHKNGSSDREKQKTALQLKLFITGSGLFRDIGNMSYRERTKYLLIVNEAVEIYNCNLSIKMALGVALFANALNCLGSERHKHFYVDVWKGKILSCLAITELEHGSDTKRLRTTAVYDGSTKEFVINTPGIGAAKCWVGNLGRYCTHALLFAQLMVKGVCHGLHGFVVPIRDPETLQPYLGITVGDIGEKSGLHGIDNGYVMFDNYRIPQDNLLNRVGDINANGEYETTFTDPQKLLGASLEILSAGRVGIVNESSSCLMRAVIIAIRYAAQRHQFCDSKGVETAILEYQTHQFRLFPILAASYAVTNFSMEFSNQYVDAVAKSQEGTLKINHAAQVVSGMHAVLCCTKAVITWTTQAAIQEAREACGGHGYHRAAGLGDLRNNHDPRVTFEGDNTVLLQQTSNWLLKFINEPDEERDFSVYPLSLIKFITKFDMALSKRIILTNKEEVTRLDFCVNCFEWLLCWLLKTTNENMAAMQSKHHDRFVVRNLCQVFKAKELSIVFGEYVIFVHFKDKIDACKEASLVPVLRNLCSLYALRCLHRHVHLLYQGGFFSSPADSEYLSEAILSLCDRIKPEAVALVDAMAPPDFILNSALGCYNGKVYENLMNAFRQQDVNRGPLSYPPFWKSKY